jgi:AcrR family transcriptional regulator
MNIQPMRIIMGRNKMLNKKIKDERREYILSTALGFFATKGLAATKITDISSKLGISQGLIYHYFRSKEEIFTELIRSAFERMNAACCHLEELDLPPLDKIRMAIVELLKGIEKNEDTSLYHLLIALATASDAIPAETKALIEKENTIAYDVMTRIIIEGQKNGSIKKHKAKDMALVFWTSIKGLAIHKAAHGKKYKTPDPEILMDMFI